MGINYQSSNRIQFQKRLNYFTIAGVDKTVENVFSFIFFLCICLNVNSQYITSQPHRVDLISTETNEKIRFHSVHFRFSYSNKLA